MRKLWQILFILFSLFFPAKSHAYMVPEIDSEYLKGIDTIIIFNGFGGEGARISGIDYLILDPATEKAIKDIFAKESWIRIYSRKQLSLQEMKNKNAVIVSFIISARMDNVDGKLMKVASLSMKITQSFDFNPQATLPSLNVTYPFFASESKDALSQQIGEGVKFLTAHLPDYFACANAKDSCGKNRVEPYHQDIERTKEEIEFLKIIRH